MRASVARQFLTVYLNRSLRCLKLYKQIRYSSTESEGSVGKSKSFQQIAKEMADRSQRVRDGPKMRPVYADFRSHRISTGPEEPIEQGDLVLLNLDPAVVLQTPRTPIGNYILVNQVGLIKEAQLNQISARLMPLIPTKLLSKPGASIYAVDGTVGAPLGITSDEDAATQSTTSIETPTGRVVSWWVYSLISMPLRQIYEQATGRAHSLLPSVLKCMEYYQSSSSSPEVIPFVTFVERVVGAGKNEVSVVDFYAVCMCLEHYSLEFKYQLNLSYTGANAIVVLPRDVELRNIKAQSSSEVDNASFVVDYARNNLPQGISEARAVELIRKQFSSQDYVDSAAAAQLLDLPRGGLYENNWTQWLFKAANSKTRLKSLLKHKRSDVLASIRKDYNKPVYCIDGSDAQEVDDGISFERLSSTAYRLGIHIANPSASLDVKKSVEDILPLTSSTYLHNNKTIPMLPKELIESSNLISQTGPKPSLTLFVDFDTESKELSNVTIEPLMLKNFINLNYNEVTIDDHRKQQQQQPFFGDFYKVALELLTIRHANGAFSFRNYTNDDLELLGVKNIPPGETIVAEFMILANRLVAGYCHARNIPIFYRKQEVQLQSKEIRSLFQGHSKSSGGLLGLAWKPVVTRSRPSIVPAEHAGLGVRMTTRFTSPLRRIEDLITHAQIGAHLLGSKQMPFSKMDLEKLRDWLQLSQFLSSRLMRMDKQIDQYSQLSPNMEVEGVVSMINENGNRNSAAVYLPKYGVNAEYAGEKKLKIEQVHKFRLVEVSALGRSAKAVLQSENS